MINVVTINCGDPTGGHPRRPKLENPGSRCLGLLSTKSGKSTAVMEWKVARSSAWTFLVTQCPTCPIAALLYALVSEAEGPYLNRPSQRKPLSVSDICPAKLL
jgi:hypothetical protein